MKNASALIDATDLFVRIAEELSDTYKTLRDVPGYRRTTPGQEITPSNNLKDIADKIEGGEFEKERINEMVRTLHREKNSRDRFGRFYHSKSQQERMQNLINKLDTLLTYLIDQ